VSRKTYCDRCGAECAYRTGHLHLAEMHARAGGEVVSQDDYKPFDLCGGCIDEIRAFLGDALVVHHYDQGPQDTALAQVVPEPFYPPS
jgi:hypothetical protein